MECDTNGTVSPSSSSSTKQQQQQQQAKDHLVISSNPVQFLCQCILTLYLNEEKKITDMEILENAFSLSSTSTYLMII